MKLFVIEDIEEQIIINNETVIDISIPSNLQKKDKFKQINIKKRNLEEEQQ